VQKKRNEVKKACIFMIPIFEVHGDRARVTYLCRLTGEKCVFWRDTSKCIHLKRLKIR